ncbi:MAG: AAA family ATPase [Thiohalorhabdus sp.]
MRIDRLIIDHYLGVQYADLFLEQPVTLVAGPNGAGKSTLRDAIRFALLGEPGRVTKKKDYGQLVSEGAREGAVTVGVSEGEETGTFTVMLPKGDSESAGTIESPDIIGYLIDADRFCSLPDGERRKVLREVSGVKASTDEVRRRLEERGCDLERAESLIPMLRSGFDAAADAAKKEASEARGAWKQVTGEQYGSQKAEGWKPQAPEHPGHDVVNEAERRVKDLEDQQRKSDAAAERAKGAEQRRQQLEADIQSAEEQAQDLEAAAAELAAASQDLEDAQAEVERARTRHLAAANLMACPDCGAQVVVEQGEEGPYLAHAADAPDVATAKAEEEQAGQRLQQARERYQAARSRKSKAESAGRTLESSRKQLEELKAEIEAVEAPDPDELQAARDHYRQVWDQAQQAIDAQRKADEAGVKHKEVQAWEALAAALAPDGIPGDLLAEALRPFNERLRETAAATGWPQVHIGADMTITAGGRPFNLLSESEQWRAGAAIAEALAYVSGVGLLVLDRLDILDIPARGQALQWLTSLADTHQVLVMGTLKSLPGSLPGGVQGVWLENGRITNSEEGA